MYIVSACLAGVKCRYDGKSNENKYVLELVSKGKALPVCPEQLGGLPTPRMPAEILNNRVITSDNKDITGLFEKGAKQAFRLCILANCDRAILKSRSPSCGFGRIYDGSFSGILVPGNGIFAEMLNDNGIKIQTA